MTLSASADVQRDLLINLWHHRTARDMCDVLQASNNVRFTDVGSYQVWAIAGRCSSFRQFISKLIYSQGIQALIGASINPSTKPLIRVYNALAYFL